jgi:hypothetical protein
MWDPKKLAAGNWFSTTMYLDVKSADGAEVLAESNDQMIAVDTKIVEEEMHSANVYASEEKLPLTKVVKVMKEREKIEKKEKLNNSSKIMIINK